MLGLFFISPILWITTISIQPIDVAYSGRYGFFPAETTLSAYLLVLVENQHNIRGALVYSFCMSSVSTVISLLIALSAIYRMKADYEITRKVKQRILQFSVGLYFLPAFVVYPGLELLSDLYDGFQQSDLQLLIVQIVLGYTVALILLLIVYASSQVSYFEQLLLETGSRTRAFAYGVVATNATGTAVVSGITFSTIWSDFFLSNLLTGTESTKPFSVVLQMAEGQYKTDYSVFAAGAVLSLFAWVLFLAIVLILSAFIYVLTKKKEAIP